MPVRLLSSSVLKWPNVQVVSQAVRTWAQDVVRQRNDVQRIGYFGSYARGDWGVGSDLDLIIILKSSLLPFERRAVEWDATGLPVPADVLVYTAKEWDTISRERFYIAAQEAVWVYTMDDR